MIMTRIWLISYVNFNICAPLLTSHEEVKSVKKLICSFTELQQSWYWQIVAKTML